MTEQAPLDLAQRRVKLRVEDYLLLDESGALEAYGKTELLDGEVYAMNAQNTPHFRIKTRLALELGIELRRLDIGLEAAVEPSVAMKPYDAPQPDIAIAGAYESASIMPLEHVRLVAEVSDSSLRDDLGRKLAIYARHRVPEYWVVDVRHGLIHQMWAPFAEGYGERREVAFGERIAAVTIPGLAVDTDALTR